MFLKIIINLSSDNIHILQIKKYFTNNFLGFENGSRVGLKNIYL